MKEERVMILNLLNDGKITADEAANLLDALNTSRAYDHKKSKQRKDHHKTYQYDYDDGDLDEKVKKFSQAVDSFSKDFSEKVSGTFKDLEPKFKKTAKTFMEKTASVVDDLAKALNESVKNMEEKMKAECCDEEEDDCCCCESENADNEPREN